MLNQLILNTMNTNENKKVMLGDPNVKGIIVKDYVNTENLFDAPIIISKHANSREYHVLLERARNKKILDKECGGECFFTTTRGQRFCFISERQIKEGIPYDCLAKNLLVELKPTK